MIIRVDLKRAVLPFCWEALRRLPLADAVLSLWAYVMRPAFLQTVFQKHRGRSFEDLLSFPVIVELMSDALLQHQGSGRQACLRADEDGLLPTCLEAFYGKLRRLPLSLSIGFLEEATQRLRALRPAAARSDEQPASLRDLTLIMVDGKALKNVAKRLLVSRGRSGKLLGGRLLVAYVPAEGVVPSFAAHEDGEANEARLIPDLIPRVRQPHFQTPPLCAASSSAASRRRRGDPGQRPLGSRPIPGHRSARGVLATLEYRERVSTSHRGV